MTTARQWLGQNTNELFLYLTTTGRKTGEPHRIEIWFGVDQDRMLLLAGGRDRSDWVKNLKVTPEVMVELGDETRQGIAQIVEPAAVEDELARDLLVSKYGKDRDLADWRQRSLPIVITFPE